VIFLTACEIENVPASLPFKMFDGGERRDYPARQSAIGIRPALEASSMDSGKRR